MSTTTALPPDPEAARRAQYRQLVRYASFGTLIVCPIIILLPPRKFDFYTVGLLIGTGFGANQTCRELTGLSIGQRVAVRVSSMSGATLPSQRARDVSAQLKLERDARRAREEGRNALAGKVDDKRGVIDAVTLKENLAEEDKKKGVVEKIWMGNEGEDWKAKRDAREKKALEEGRGYGGLIMDQIWEVWSWGKDKAEEIKEIDEKVVKERKDERNK